MTKIAILDDYQNIALDMADWGALGDTVEITVFNDHLADEEAVAARLAPFDVVILNRERTPVPKSLIDALPNLRLLVTSGMYNRSVDIAAARQKGITLCGTQSFSSPTPELTWGLILSLARQIPREDRNVREGRWQTTVGIGLEGKVLGVIGLGRLGTPVAKIGLAFGMDVAAWSPNLTDERAAQAGVRRLSKEALFADSDFITVHMPLSERSRGLIAAPDLARMKPTAFLINTSRGPIVDEAALIDALSSRRIAGAGLDVYDVEPLPADHPFRSLPNTVVSPHLGYVTEENYRLNNGQFVENILAWLDGSPLRVIEPK